jgi:hypothetical protein
VARQLRYTATCVDREELPREQRPVAVDKLGEGSRGLLRIHIQTLLPGHRWKSNNIGRSFPFSSRSGNSALFRSTFE